MNIIKVEKSQLEFIQNFLSSYEETCVQLCHYVRKESEHVYAVTECNFIDETSEILGVLYLDGTFLHCITNLIENDEFKTALKLFCIDKKIKCINGEAGGTDLIVQILNNLGRVCSQVNNYDLMLLEDNVIEPKEALCNGDEIIRCSINDFDSLFELQKNYLVKEVAPVGKQVSDFECSAALKIILKNQICLGIYSDGEAVAKANSNAIGWKWVQIGGVYTHPLYRRNGYAWHLMAALCKKIQKTGRKVCLFVKEKNTPAKELYFRMGFKIFCKYEIAYFESKKD